MRSSEIILFNESPYKLPAPEAPPVLAPAQPNPGENKSPHEWVLFVVWRQRRVVFGTVLIAVLAALAYLRLTPPSFISTSRIYVQQAGPRLSMSGPGQPGITQPTSSNYLQAQRELITSDPVLTIASVLPEVSNTNTVKGSKNPLATLRNVTGADVDKGSDIISVIALCATPEDAQAISNGVVKAYMAYQTKPKWSNTVETLQILHARKSEVETELKASTGQLHEMEMKYGLLSRQDDRANITVRRLQGLSEALTQAQLETVDAQTAFEEARKSFGTRVTVDLEGETDDRDFAASTPQELAVLRSEMLQAQTQLQELQQHYGVDHPRIVGLRHRIDRLNVSYVTAVQRRWISARRRLADLQRSYDEEQKRGIEFSARAAEYSRLEGDIDRVKKLRDTYDERIREIELARDAGGLNIDVLEPARIEPTPAFPRKSRVFAIAISVGLALGLVFSCIREWVDDKFQSPSEMKSALGVPVLAVIPQTHAKRSPSVSGQRILLDPASDAAEAYRSLRTAVQFSAPPEHLKTILVSSPNSGDGKTTLASNLAIAMAQAGKHVLLVDADLRKPMQHEIFNVKNNVGLSSLLAGRCSIDTAIHRTQVTGLEILPCGPVPANPTEILNSREFTETLDQLSEKYDCVLLDSPPVEACSDAQIIAASCDATILVLKAQTAHRRQAEHSKEALQSVGARIIGLVVNDLPRRPQAAYGATGANRRYVPGLTTQEFDILQSRSK
jgi:capsular exopolysaccharide synthesis family protein